MTAPQLVGFASTGNTGLPSVTFQVPYIAGDLIVVALVTTQTTDSPSALQVNETDFFSLPPGASEPLTIDAEHDYIEFVDFVSPATQQWRIALFAARAQRDGDFVNADTPTAFADRLMYAFVVRGISWEAPLSSIITIGSTTGVASQTSITIPGVTTTVPDCFIIAPFGARDPGFRNQNMVFSNFAAAGVENFSGVSTPQIADIDSTDKTIGVMYGTKSSPGATGSLTASLNLSSHVVGFAIAIAPGDLPHGPYDSFDRASYPQTPNLGVSTSGSTWIDSWESEWTISQVSGDSYAAGTSDTPDPQAVFPYGTYEAEITARVQSVGTFQSNNRGGIVFRARNVYEGYYFRNTSTGWALVLGTFDGGSSWINTTLASGTSSSWSNGVCLLARCEGDTITLFIDSVQVYSGVHSEWHGTNFGITAEGGFRVLSYGIPCHGMHSAELQLVGVPVDEEDEDAVGNPLRGSLVQVRSWG